MFKKIKDAIKINRALNQFEEIKEEMEMNSLKSFVFSKRNWVSILGLVATLADIVPPKIGIVLTAVAVAGTKVLDIVSAK